MTSRHQSINCQYKLLGIQQQAKVSDCILIKILLIFDNLIFVFVVINGQKMKSSKRNNSLIQENSAVEGEPRDAAVIFQDGRLSSSI